jgi:hypothetical protein
MKKNSKVISRLPHIDELADQIWPHIGTYKDDDWDLPKKRLSLENLIGADKTNDLYDMTSKAAQNIRLRSLVTDFIKSKNLAVRLAAIKFVVVNWGSIPKGVDNLEKWLNLFKNFEPDVIERFITDKYNHRVASWSKVLAFADSENYAIYDARVVMSLNTILDGLNHSRQFYMPSTRIKTIRKNFNFMKKQVLMLKMTSEKKLPYLGYFDYIDLLKAMVAKGLAVNILDIEMRLFSRSKHFEEIYSEKYNINT